MKNIVLLLTVLLSAVNVFAQEKKSKEGVQSEIIIDATPEEVWAIVTDLKSYEVWHSFIYGIEGELGLDEKLKVEIEVLNKKVKIRARITVLNKNKNFTWVGKLPAIGKATHYYKLKALEGGRTKLTQGEFWKGVGAKVYAKKHFMKAYKDKQKMNKKIKKMVEGK